MKDQAVNVDVYDEIVKSFLLIIFTDLYKICGK